MTKRTPEVETPLVPISEAESDVMQVLWHQSPLDAESIHAALAAQRDWQLATVKTLLNRLLRKGAVQADKAERRFLYTPVLARESWQRAQGMGLLDRLFGGRLSPLVTHFARERRLHPEDVEALRALLDAQPVPKGRAAAKEDAPAGAKAAAPGAVTRRGRRG